MGAYSPTATIAATAIVSLAIGFGAATWVASGKTDNKPIINPTAWEETAPEPEVQTVSFTNSAPASSLATAQPVGAQPIGSRCSPWEVTDVAMEEILSEMIARGWRPPYQGDAVAAMGVSGISTDDPNAPMPYRRNWLPVDPNGEAISDSTVPAPNDPAGGPAQPAAIDQPSPTAATPTDS